MSLVNFDQIDNLIIIFLIRMLNNYSKGPTDND